MSNKHTVSDEALVASLIQHGTIKDSAEAVGITARAFYDRMKDREFCILYAAAKADLVRSAVFEINRRLSAAIDTVSALMVDEKVNPAVRLQSAQTILANAEKFSQRLNVDEKRSIDARNPLDFDFGF